jgi:hypothetical protein
MGNDFRFLINRCTTELKRLALIMRSSPSIDKRELFARRRRLIENRKMNITSPLLLKMVHHLLDLITILQELLIKVTFLVASIMIAVVYSEL